MSEKGQAATGMNAFKRRGIGGMRGGEEEMGGMRVYSDERMILRCPSALITVDTSSLKGCCVLPFLREEASEWGMKGDLE